MRSFLLVALVCVAFVAQLTLATRSNSLAWSRFKRQHGKNYASEAEEARRFATFLTTKTQIERHNANASNAYKLGLNHLADWTREERAKLNGFKWDTGMLAERKMSAEDESYLETLMGDDKPAPTEVDWRKVPNRVSAVKDQGQCGSCWAFASTGVLEGQQGGMNELAKKKKITLLSEQELVDCSKENKGCNGGIMEQAFNDIHALGGIMSERDYPYLADDEPKCLFNRSKSVMTDAAGIAMEKLSEEKLRKLVANYGPVSTALFATDKLQDYASGVFVDHTCPVGDLNHAVLLVGYGTDPKAGDYWIVKNSWSETWGESGYFKIKRGVNMCGIETIPTIAKL